MTAARHKVVHLPVNAGPDGKTFVRLEQSKRKSRRRYDTLHLVTAFFFGGMFVLLGLVAMIAWGRP